MGGGRRDQVSLGFTRQQFRFWVAGWQESLKTPVVVKKDWLQCEWMKHGSKLPLNQHNRYGTVHFLAQIKFFHPFNNYGNSHNYGNYQFLIILLYGWFCR